MSFLRVEKKKSGTYLRIVVSYREGKRTKHRTLHSLGKVEDYPPQQLERIAVKLLELAGRQLEDVVGNELKEIRRVNYGYALIIKHLWGIFKLKKWAKQCNSESRIRFDWVSVLELMLADRLNIPQSKRASFQFQGDYIGFSDEKVSLQHFYRTLDVLAAQQETLKTHLLHTQQTLFSGCLDLVFYDVTTLYFESQKEEEGTLRQKGYSKDGKAGKTQIVLGLLVDNQRNPISYHLYKGNTYEGKTMQDALENLRKTYKIGRIIAVADSAMIDKSNRTFMEESENITYILGDRLKNLPHELREKLIDKSKHTAFYSEKESYTFSEETYQGRRIICTYSEKRARKDKYEREKLIAKAEKLLAKPAQLKQSKKRGAGRFIQQDGDENYVLDVAKIQEDARWDGFKAIATTTKLTVNECISKYKDLFEVEHAFRSLKSQLKVRPIFHWTDKRIEGHIAMCFIAYAFLNYLRVKTEMTEKELVRTLDKMQLSEIEESKKEEHFFLRAALDKGQKKLIQKLKLVVPRDTEAYQSINQYFM
jgi:transposase